MSELDKTGLEAAARAMCVEGGFDPDKIMTNDGPLWRYYVPGAEAAISAYLSSTSAGVTEEQTPRVKQLEWVATGQTGFLECQHYAVAGSLWHTCHPINGEDGPFPEHYDIRHDKWDDDVWSVRYWVGNNGLSGISGEFDTLEAAKAAAQADYEARIRSALHEGK